MTKHVGIWIRVSTEDQAKGESPETHLKRAENYAELKGWAVEEVYRLDGVSGKSVMAATETKRMLKDVREGRITGLIFSKLARLARNTKELLEFSDTFRAHGADLISLKESIDTSSPAGRLYYTIISAMAQWEREEIAERVADAVPIRAREGKSLGGQAPYGYRWDGKKLAIEPSEAHVRKLMFELYKEHKRKRTVATILNNRGFRTRKGAMFSDTTILRLLADPLAKGLRRMNYTKSTGIGKKWKLKAKEDWVFNEAPAIVDASLWEEVNGIIHRQAGSAKKPAKKRVNLFTGVVRCECGSRMYVLSNTPKYVCPTCKRKILKDDLETIFHEQLRSYVFSEADMAEQLGEQEAHLREKQEVLGELKRREREVQGKLDELLDLVHRKELPKEGFHKYHEPLYAQLIQLQESQISAHGELDLLNVQVASREEVLSDARNLFDRWADLSQEEKRNIIEVIVDEIIVGDSEIEISLAYLTPSQENLTHSQRNYRGSWRPPA